jgi:hypothetical protein
MALKFHVSSKTQGAVPVGSSAVLGVENFVKLKMSGDAFFRTANQPPNLRRLAHRRSVWRCEALRLPNFSNLPLRTTFRRSAAQNPPKPSAPQIQIAGNSPPTKSPPKNLATVSTPNDPKLSHGHWKPGSACNLDFQISSAHPKTQGAVAVGSSAVLGIMA